MSERHDNNTITQCPYNYRCFKCKSIGKHWIKQCPKKDVIKCMNDNSNASHLTEPNIHSDNDETKTESQTDLALSVSPQDNIIEHNKCIQMELETQKQQNKQLSNDKNIAIESIEECKNKICIMDKELKDMKNQNIQNDKMYNQKIEILIKQITELKKNEQSHIKCNDELLNDKNKLIVSLEENNIELNQIKLELNNKINEFECINKELLVKYNTLENERNEYKNQNEVLLNKYNDIEKDKNDCNKTIEQITNELNNMKQKIITNENIFNDKLKKLDVEKEDLIQEKNKLKAVNDKLLNKLKEQNDQNDKIYNQKIQIITNNVVELEKQVQLQIKSNNELLNDKNKLITNAKEYNIKIKQMEIEINNKINQINDFECTNKQLEQQMQQNKELLSKYNTLENERNKYKNQNEELLNKYNDDIEQITNELNDMKQKIITNENIFNDKLKKLNTEKGDLIGKKNKLKTLNDKLLKKLEEHNDQNNEYKQKNALLQNEMNELKQRFETNILKYNKLSKKCNNIERELDKCMNENKAIMNDRDELLKKLKEYNIQNDEYKQKIVELESAINEHKNEDDENMKLKQSELVLNNIQKQPNTTKPNENTTNNTQREDDNDEMVGEFNISKLYQFGKDTSGQDSWENVASSTNLIFYQNTNTDRIRLICRENNTNKLILNQSMFQNIEKKNEKQIGWFGFNGIIEQKDNNENGFMFSAKFMDENVANEFYEFLDMASDNNKDLTKNNNNENENNTETVYENDDKIQQFNANKLYKCGKDASGQDSWETVASSENLLFYQNENSGEIRLICKENNTNKLILNQSMFENIEKKNEKQIGWDGLDSVIEQKDNDENGFSMFSAKFMDENDANEFYEFLVMASDTNKELMKNNNNENENDTETVYENDEKLQEFNISKLYQFGKDKSGQNSWENIASSTNLIFYQNENSGKMRLICRDTNTNKSILNQSVFANIEKKNEKQIGWDDSIIEQKDNDQNGYCMFSAKFLDEDHANEFYEFLSMASECNEQDI